MNLASALKCRAVVTGDDTRIVPADAYTLLRDAAQNWHDFMNTTQDEHNPQRETPEDYAARIKRECSNLGEKLKTKDVRLESRYIPQSKPLDAIVYPERRYGMDVRLDVASRIMQGMVSDGASLADEFVRSELVDVALKSADALLKRADASWLTDEKWKEQIAAYMRMINEYRNARKFHVHKDGLDEAMDGITEHHIYPDRPKGNENKDFVTLVEVPAGEIGTHPYPDNEIGEYRDCDKVIQGLLEEMGRLAVEIDRLKKDWRANQVQELKAENEKLKAKVEDMAAVIVEANNVLSDMRAKPIIHIYKDEVPTEGSSRPTSVYSGIFPEVGTRRFSHFRMMSAAEVEFTRVSMQPIHEYTEEEED